MFQTCSWGFLLASALEMQRVVLSLWPIPFNNSSPAEVNVIPTCFLRQREKLHHTVGSPEIKKETDTQMQLQLSLPDLHFCTCCTSKPSLGPSAFFLFPLLHFPGWTSQSVLHNYKWSEKSIFLQPQVTFWRREERLLLLYRRKPLSYTDKCVWLVIA